MCVAGSGGRSTRRDYCWRALRGSPEQKGCLIPILSRLILQRVGRRVPMGRRLGVTQHHRNGQGGSIDAGTSVPVPSRQRPDHPLAGPGNRVDQSQAYHRVQTQSETTLFLRKDHHRRRFRALGDVDPNHRPKEHPVQAPIENARERGQIRRVRGFCGLSGFFDLLDRIATGPHDGAMQGGQRHHVGVRDPRRHQQARGHQDDSPQLHLPHTPSASETVTALQFLRLCTATLRSILDYHSVLSIRINT